MPDKTEIEELTTSLRQYVNTGLELVKLETAKQSSLVASSLVSGVIILISGLLFVLFLSLGLGYYLCNLLESNYAGFIIVAGFYLLVAVIVIAWRKKLVEKPLRDKIIKKIFSEN